MFSSCSCSSARLGSYNRSLHFSCAFVIVYVTVGTAAAAAAASVRDIDAPDVPFIPFVVVASKLSPSLPSAHPYASE